MLFSTWKYLVQCLTHGSADKESACSVGDIGDESSVTGSGRSPREGNGNPLRYSCLKNPMDRRAWRATVQRVTSRHDWTWARFKKTNKKKHSKQTSKKKKPWPIPGPSSLLVCLYFSTWRHCRVCNAGTPHLWKMVQRPNLQGLNHILLICKVKSLPTLEFPWILVKTLLLVSNKNSTQTPSN